MKNGKAAAASAAVVKLGEGIPRWEYQAIEFGYHGPRDLHVDYLQEEGYLGWEVVSVIQDPKDSSLVWAIAKRPLYGYRKCPKCGKDVNAAVEECRWCEEVGE